MTLNHETTDASPADAWPPPGQPVDPWEWALNAAHLLELADEFFAGADEGVHMALGDFFAARGEHPITAPDGFIDALGVNALAIRSAKAGEPA